MDDNKLLMPAALPRSSVLALYLAIWKRLASVPSPGRPTVLIYAVLQIYAARQAETRVDKTTLRSCILCCRSTRARKLVHPIRMSIPKVLTNTLVYFGDSLVQITDLASFSRFYEEVACILEDKRWGSSATPCLSWTFSG